MKIKCIKCEPNKNAKIVDIEDNLKSWQQVVGGYIEYVYPFQEQPVGVICNEEGKLEGLPFSRPILDDNDALVDIIAGTCYIVGLDDKGGNRSLTDMEIKLYEKLWRYPIKVYRWVLKDSSILGIEPFDEKNGRKVKAYGR